MTEFWSGIGLTAVGLLTWVGWYGGLKAALVDAGIIAPRMPQVPEPSQSAASPTHDEDLDRLLRPLAETVLRDLTEQLAAKEHAGGGRQL